MTSNESEPTMAQRAERATDGSRQRILVVGAGIAGATLAALLRRRGEAVALIERAGPLADEGYMLGMMPLGGRVLNGLGLVEAYHRTSIPMREYDLYDRRGQLANSYPLASFVEQFGDWRGIERGALVELLRSEAGPISFETTITSIEDREDRAAVTFGDGSRATFDLVVGADGIQSSTRRLILDTDEVEDFDTGWGGFVCWTQAPETDTDTYSELWSAGWGVGIYPVPGRLGVFLAGRHHEIVDRDVQGYARELVERVPDGVFASALGALDLDAPAFYWRMADCRARTWSRGRTVLLGDAAAAFLPTAGVGASAAMDSAAALADELSRSDATHIGYALELYEKRQRHRVELAQKNSRDLARYMFVNAAPLAMARDHLMRFYTLDHMISDVSKVMDGA
ncbi:MAG: FAD-dependent monooxygenase [Microthrixaceae bacterium]|nr:FAD-dependent monooxygenase [Microthrixaceae bacterium]